MNKKRLVWLSVNSSYSHSSLALPLLHSACENVTGWEWFCVETTVDEDEMEIAARLEALQGDLVCATLYLFNRRSVLSILKRFHVLSPDCSIVVGGPECLGAEAETLWKENLFIHTVFRGEGESVFPDFLSAFSSGLPRSVIPPDGSSVDREWAKSSAPVKDKFFRTDKPFVQVETSRGCPMGCLYCTSCHTELRFKEISSVVAELTALRARGVEEIRILDRTFNFPPERGSELLRLFRTDFPQLRFHLEIHPQLLNDGIRSELSMANPGQLHIEAGIQSLNQNVQNAIGRRSPPEDALDGLRFLCASPRFETHADLLSGLPEQTLDSLFDDVSSLMSAAPAEIQLEVLKILPGTPLRLRAGEFGLIFNPESPYDVMRTGTMSVEDILLSRHLSRLLDLTWNHPSLHPFLKTAYHENPFFIRGLLECFMKNGLDLKRLFDLKKRFLILADFFASGSYETVREELAFHWIFSGYPPEHVPFGKPERVRSIPEDAVLICGNSEVLKDRETKYWRLPGRHTDSYFAFHRKFAINRAAAVYCVSSIEKKPEDFFLRA